MSPSLFDSLNISRLGMLNRLTQLDGVSNNLSNINTAGYKAVRLNFQELLDAQVSEGGKLVASQVITQQGAVQTTQNPLDWAIEGDGYFPLRLPGGGTGYTRDGQFTRDASGDLVSSSGYLLDWQGELPEDTQDISVQQDGSVQVLRQNGETVTAGTLELARFTNPSALINAGSNVFLESLDSGAAQRGAPGTENFGVVHTSTVEQSNTDISAEMTNMVVLQRAFQMSTRAFQQTDTMIGLAIHMRK